MSSSQVAFFVMSGIPRSWEGPDATSQKFSLLPAPPLALPCCLSQTGLHPRGYATRLIRGGLTPQTRLGAAATQTLCMRGAWVAAARQPGGTPQSEAGGLVGVSLQGVEASQASKMLASALEAPVMQVLRLSSQARSWGGLSPPPSPSSECVGFPS